MSPQKISPGSEPDFESTAFFESIPLARLAVNPQNARRFEENMTAQRRARFDELVASVREKGILEPLLVRQSLRDRYTIIAGERRYRAALQVVKDLGLDPAGYEVPCMVHDVDEEDAFDLMVIENLLREDLSPFEAAQAFHSYLERRGNTPEAAAELAARTGIPAHAIRRQVRLLDLPSEVLAAWKEGALTQSHVELFTRVADREQTLDLLAACQRSRLSTRELAERIGAICPDLGSAFFDKEECQGCQFNSAVQSGLFADATPGGRCGNPACFEGKQGGWFREHWTKSKAAGKFGTRGFAFSHRLAQQRREPIIGRDPAARCLECDAFVSVLRLTGAVVGGYERTCTGPSPCFEELYRGAPAQDDAPMNDVDGCGRGRETCPGDESTCPDCLDPGPETVSRLDSIIKKLEHVSYSPAAPGLGEALAAARERKTSAPQTPASPPPEETGPVFSASRGERFRKAFLDEVLPDKVNGAPSSSPPCLRLVLTALALSESAVKTHLLAGLGLSNNVKPDQLAKKIFEIPPADLPAQLVGAGLVKILNDFTLMPAVRQLVAEKFDVDIARDWRLTADYLNALTKSEIVRIGEEPRVAIWKDEAVDAYRRDHHKGKALLSLKKEELIDMILKSGADLAGRVPAEIVGTPPK